MQHLTKPRMELLAAVLSVRLATTRKELRLKIDQVLILLYRFINRPPMDQFYTLSISQLGS